MSIEGTFDIPLNPLAAMANSEDFVFYPTGSRFFGDHTNESDHDFFALYSSPIKIFLKQIGFVRETKNSRYKYTDRSLVSLLVHPTYQIHIQLVKDLEAKIEAQNDIKILHDQFPAIYTYFNGDRANRVWLWNAMIQQATNRLKLKNAIFGLVR